MKVCKGCFTSLPISRFYVHSDMSDGHLSFCKECVCARVKKHRNANLDNIRSYDRARAKTPESIKRRTQNTKTFRRKNPEKYAAHSAVGSAIKAGKLKKQPCRKCGDSSMVHAHHYDYSKPLDVVWLCPACHSELHRKKGIDVQ